MLGAPNLSSSVEHTFLLGGWELFLFVWYPKKENAMFDNIAVGLCCVVTEILAGGLGVGGVRGGKHNILGFLCAEHLYWQQCSNMKNSLIAFSN